VLALAALETRSSFRLWRKVPVGLRRPLARLWLWLVAAAFLIVPVAVIGGYSMGVNDPFFSRREYTKLAMATGVLQLGVVLSAILAAAARDSLVHREGTPRQA